ncbi:MAG: hypothetical protein ACK47N_18740, partial [Microcystis sp.]
MGVIYGKVTAKKEVYCLETWVNEHQRSREGITGWKIGEKEATDDRCGELLRTLGSSDSLDQ